MGSQKLQSQYSKHAKNVTFLLNVRTGKQKLSQLVLIISVSTETILSGIYFGMCLLGHRFCFSFRLFWGKSLY